MSDDYPSHRSQQSDRNREGLEAVVYGTTPPHADSWSAPLISLASHVSSTEKLDREETKPCQSSKTCHPSPLMGKARGLPASLTTEPLTFSKALEHDNPLRSEALKDLQEVSNPIPCGDSPKTPPLAHTSTESHKISDGQDSLGSKYEEGRQPFITRDRWRLYCFQNTFVIEPNIPNKGICHRFTLHELRHLPMMADQLDKKLHSQDSNPLLDPPQLIIFRASSKVLQVKNIIHPYYKEFGCLDAIRLIDSLLGVIEIHKSRFLVVVSESECVCGFNRESFDLNKDIVKVPPVGSSGRRNMFVYRIRQARLLYFRPSSKKLTSLSEKVDETPFNAENSGRLQDLLARRPSFQRYAEHLVHPRSSQLNTQTNRPPEETLTFPRTTLRPRTLKDSTSMTLPDTDLTPSHSKSFSEKNFFSFSVSCDSFSTHTANGDQTKFPVVRLKDSYSDDGLGFLMDELGEKVISLKRNLEKLLCTSFYYSYDCDITHTLQRKRQLSIPFDPQSWPCSYMEDAVESSSSEPSTTAQNHSKPSSQHTTSHDVCLLDIADKRFVWNIQLIKPFNVHTIDRRWFVPIIQGSVSSATLLAGIHALDLILFCRKSWARSGTRYNHRGIDDSGEVANFNESEQLIALSRIEYKKGYMFYRGSKIPQSGWNSFVQIRGSVPVFWEQSGGLALTTNINLTRQLEFAIDAFKEHQRQLSLYYGKVCYIDLLSQSKGGENKLSLSLRNLINDYNQKILSRQSQARSATHVSSVVPDIEQPTSLIQFDCHYQIKQHGLEKALSQFVNYLRPQLEEFGYYSEKPLYAEHPTIQFQKGFLRVNCLDCLDRTNIFQWYICWHWVSTFLKNRHLEIFLDPVFQGKRLLLVHQNTRDIFLRFPPRGLPYFMYFVHRGLERCFLALEHDLKLLGGESLSVLEANAARSSFFGMNEETFKTMSSSSLSSSETIYVHYNGSNDGPLYWEYKSLRHYLYLKKIFPVEPGSSLSYPPVNELDLLEISKNITKDVVARMWADQGDRISRAYTGTNSVMSSVIRQGKSTLTTNVAHMFTSLGRLYQNKFEDDCRQDVIDLLLQEPVNSSAFQDDQSQCLIPTPNVPSCMNLLCQSTPCNLFLEKKNVETSHDDQLPMRDMNIHETQTLPSSPPYHVPSPQYIPHVRPIRVWFGTWNMGGFFAPDTVPAWLFPSYAGGEAHDPSTADIYVTAVQELVELTKVRVLLSQNDREREEKLEQAIKQSLGPHFIMLKSHSLVGLHLAVFLRSSLKHYVTKVHVSDLKLGFKGQMGNKGAIFLRFMLANISFCFVNVHLSSGLEKAKQRQDQLSMILESTFQVRLPYRVRDHDCVIVGGDFNFRSCATYREAMDLVKREAWKDLLLLDQFVMGKRAGALPFLHLFESDISFPPTYKFKKDTNEFDEGRSPGWCDRVFYTGHLLNTLPTHPLEKKTPLKCIAYDYLPTICVSDHKPVFAVFETNVTFPIIDHNGIPPFSPTPLSLCNELRRNRVILGQETTGSQNNHHHTQDAIQTGKPSCYAPSTSPLYCNTFHEQHSDLLTMPKVDSGTRTRSPQDNWSSEEPSNAPNVNTVSFVNRSDSSERGKQEISPLIGVPNPCVYLDTTDAQLPEVSLLGHGAPHSPSSYLPETTPTEQHNEFKKPTSDDLPLPYLTHSNSCQDVLSEKTQSLPQKSYDWIAYLTEKAVMNLSSNVSSSSYVTTPNLTKSASGDFSQPKSETVMASANSCNPSSVPTSLAKEDSVSPASPPKNI